MSLLTYSLIKKYLDERFGRIERALGTPIYGVAWDKSSDPTLVRTDDAVGMTAGVGVGDELAINDFDHVPIFGEMHDVVDSYGNVFVRIPKLYIRKTDGPDLKTWQVSKVRYPGFYLPWCFWDFDRGIELPHIDVGKHLASLGEGDRLESRPGTYPLVNTNIVNFRAYAQNNNTGEAQGYQQLDIHVQDLLRTLMFVEFGTLNTQSVMRGFVDGEYSDSHVALVTEADANRIIITESQAGGYRVGQSLGIGSSRSSNAVVDYRTIVSIEPEGEGTALVFDGDPINVTEGDVVANRGFKTGFGQGVAASSGSPESNTDGKWPCVYRGIESPYGDIYQFVDGVNINDHQAWVARNRDDYASNVFAAPYERLGYANSDANGYIVETGSDPEHLYAEFPEAVGGSSSTYYADYYYQNTSQRIAHVGGYWSGGLVAGPSFWRLSASSGAANVILGGRLLKTP